LQVQASRAKVIGPANAGSDAINSIKQAAEFGVVPGSQKLVKFAHLHQRRRWPRLEVAPGMLLANAFL
jgi:branched-chain amino acid transport system substrate-binding protein